MSNKQTTEPWYMRRLNPTKPASLVYHFIGLRITLLRCLFRLRQRIHRLRQHCLLIQNLKMALKSKEVKRQYPNLLEKFLDFCKLEGDNVEQKATKFYLFAKSKSKEELEDLVIKFILIFLNIKAVQLLLEVISRPRDL
jgi:hypothetical protein